MDLQVDCGSAHLGWADLALLLPCLIPSSSSSDQQAGFARHAFPIATVRRVNQVVQPVPILCTYHWANTPLTIASHMAKLRTKR